MAQVTLDNADTRTAEEKQQGTPLQKLIAKRRTEEEIILAAFGILEDQQMQSQKMSAPNASETQALPRTPSAAASGLVYCPGEVV